MPRLNEGCPPSWITVGADPSRRTAVTVMVGSPEKSSPSDFEKASLNQAVLSPMLPSAPTGRPLQTEPFRSRSVHSSGLPYQTCSDGASGGYGSGGTKPGCEGTVTGQAFEAADEPGRSGVERSSRSPTPAQAEMIRVPANPATIVLNALFMAPHPLVLLLAPPGSGDRSARSRSEIVAAPEPSLKAEVRSYAGRRERSFPPRVA